MDNSATFRATPEFGDTIDDPSADELLLLFEHVENGGSSFLIVHDLRDPSGHTYAQTSRNDDGTYVVEYRAGSADQHFGTTAADMRAAYALVVGWAFDFPGWRESAAWSAVTF